MGIVTKLIGRKALLSAGGIRSGRRTARAGANFYLNTAGEAGSAALKLNKLQNIAVSGADVYQIIRKAYESEAFYRASWRIKAQILAKNIIRSPEIQVGVGNLALSELIYSILKRNRNKQGNKILAAQIEIVGDITYDNNPGSSVTDSDLQSAYAYLHSR